MSIMYDIPQTPYRVNHSPVQRIREELRPGGGDLFYKALYVLAFLLRVDVALGRNFCPVEPQALVVVAVIQWNQFPFTRLLVRLLVIELVENAFHARQLLSLRNAVLTGAVGGAWT